MNLPALQMEGARRFQEVREVKDETVFDKTMILAIFRRQEIQQ